MKRKAGWVLVAVLLVVLVTGADCNGSGNNARPPVGGGGSVGHTVAGAVIEVLGPVVLDLVWENLRDEFRNTSYSVIVLGIPYGARTPAGTDTFTFEYYWYHGAKWKPDGARRRVTLKAGQAQILVGKGTEGVDMTFRVVSVQPAMGLVDASGGRADHLSLTPGRIVQDREPDRNQCLAVRRQYLAKLGAGGLGFVESK